MLVARLVEGVGFVGEAGLFERARLG